MQEYLFDTYGLNVLRFNSVNKLWLEFVYSNRILGNTHSYDVVIGPIADDQIWLALT